MKAFITAAFHPEYERRLRRHMDVVCEDWRTNHKIYFDAEEFAEKINAVGADVVIVEADLVHQDVLDRCALKLIGCCRGDPINIGRDRATELGIPVLYTPARNADAVADLTLAFMLALARNVVTVTTLLRQGEVRFGSAKDYVSFYDRYGGFELGGATVGIVGMGAIGRGVARRLQGFGARVIGFDPHVADETFATYGVSRVPIDDLVREVDVLTVHCPALPETFHLIDAARLSAMKPGALVLNLARAQVIDEDALYEAVKRGQLGGAALDVVQDEPLQPENRFLTLPNVIVAPHLGGATRDVVRHQSRMIVEDIEALLSRQRPRYLLNPEVLQRDPLPFFQTEKAG